MNRPPDPAAEDAGSALAELLTRLRHRARLTQEELAERASMTARAISDLERGVARRPRRDTVDRLVAALRLTGAEVDRFRTVARGDPVGPGVPSGSTGPVWRERMPAQLPRTFHDFVGRAELVAAVTDQLVPGEAAGAPIAPALCCLWGRPGAGKTTLALHVAHLVRDAFPDGQLFADLRGVFPGRAAAPDEVLAAFLRALGVDGAAVPVSPDERMALFRSLVADRRMLLVLDDAGSEAQVRPLLPGTASCSVLVTSRRRLTGLEDAMIVPVAGLAAAEADALLCRLVGDRVRRDPVAAQRLAAQCGRLPLALRVAGARLASRPHWSVSTMLDLLTDERRLDQLVAGDLGVRTSIDVSYQSLDGPLELALRRLSLLDLPDFAAWTAAAVLDTGVDAAQQALDTLADVSLLDRTPAESPWQARYRFHDLIRDFARERSHAEDAEPDRRAALGRAVAAFVDLADRHERRMHSSTLRVHPLRSAGWRPPGGWGEYGATTPDGWFDDERDGVVAVVDQAARLGLVEPAVDLADCLASVGATRGHLDAWRAATDRALAAGRTHGDRVGVATMLQRTADLHAYIGELDRAGELVDAALAQWRALGSPAGVGYALTLRGSIDRAQGRLTAATATLDEAIDVLAGTDQPVALGFAYAEAGYSARIQGRFAESLERFGQALAIFEAHDNPCGVALASMGVGDVHRATGELTDSARQLARALSAARELGDRRVVAQALVWLGGVQRERADLPSAEQALREAAEHYAALRIRDGEAHVLYGLGEVARLQGRLAEAAAVLGAGLRLFTELGLLLWAGRTLDALATVDLARGDRDGAARHWRRAHALFTELAVPEAVAVRSRLDELVAADRAG